MSRSFSKSQLESYPHVSVRSLVQRGSEIATEVASLMDDDQWSEFVRNTRAARASDKSLDYEALAKASRSLVHSVMMIKKDSSVG